MLPLIGVSLATFDSTKGYVSNSWLKSDQYFKNRSYGSKCVQTNSNYILYDTSCLDRIVVWSLSSFPGRFVSTSWIIKVMKGICEVEILHWPFVDKRKQQHIRFRQYLIITGTQLTPSKECVSYCNSSRSECDIYKYRFKYDCDKV